MLNKLKTKMKQFVYDFGMALILLIGLFVDVV